MAARRPRQAELVRLASPASSNRACLGTLARDHCGPINTDQRYRMADALDEGRIARRQSIVFDEVRGRLDEAVEVLFFDVTTLLFASKRYYTLRQDGLSKDGRPHEGQVVLAFFQPREGLPIGYELFPGIATDVCTLQPAFKWAGSCR